MYVLHRFYSFFFDLNFSYFLKFSREGTMIVHTMRPTSWYMNMHFQSLSSQHASSYLSNKNFYNSKRKLASNEEVAQCALKEKKFLNFNHLCMYTSNDHWNAWNVNTVMWNVHFQSSNEIKWRTSFQFYAIYLYICCIIKANLREDMNLRRWVSLSSFQSAKIIIKTSGRCSHTEMYSTFRHSSISIVNFYRFILWDGSHSLDADIQIVDSTISVYMYTCARALSQCIVHSFIHSIVAITQLVVDTFFVLHKLHTQSPNVWMYSFSMPLPFI